MGFLWRQKLPMSRSREVSEYASAYVAQFARLESTLYSLLSGSSGRLVSKDARFRRRRLPARSTLPTARTLLSPSAPSSPSSALASPTSSCPAAAVRVRRILYATPLFIWYNMDIYHIRALINIQFSYLWFCEVSDKYKWIIL